MTAVCTRCGRPWNISIRTSPADYVCLDCEWRDKLVRAGVIKEAKSIENSIGTYGNLRRRAVDRVSL